jgi:hypothetical protein
MFRRFLPLLAVALVAGCGGTAHEPAHHAAAVPRNPVAQALAPASSQSCPPGQAQMGCSLHTIAQNPLAPHNPMLSFGAPAGALFPDVSSWQGNVNWPAVAAWQSSHGWHRLAIWKLGEYHLDPYAGRNASETARLGFSRAGYWFVRNIGCANEAAAMIWAARRYGLHVIVEDDEVPEAAGYSTCLTPRLRAAGLVVVIYAGTGTWPGGISYGSPWWVASYGPGFGCLWTCNPVAWQFSDGHFGSPRYIPGIGFGDVSVDRGIGKLFAPPKPKPSPSQIAKWTRARDSSQRAYLHRGCGVLAQRERWFSARLHGRLAAKHRRSLIASRAAYRHRSCAVYASRIAYYDRRLRS